MFASYFFDIVEENLGTVLNQSDSIKRASEMMSISVSGGKKVFVFDRYGIIDNELVNRTSGLALFRSLNNDISRLVEGDILIISSFHPDNENDLNQASKANALSASVISISPMGELAQSADVALLNNDDGRNGVIKVSGIDRQFCPVSGIMNAVLAWALVAETTQLLIAEGKIPTVYCGDYVIDGKEKLSQARKRFSSFGY